MSQTVESSQVVEVKVRPGESVKCRTLPVFRTITGRRLGKIEQVTLSCASVLSEMPPEYQDDCSPFRDAIQAAARVKLKKHACETARGTQWLRDATIDDSPVYLDVTRCNHLPMHIYGSVCIPDEVGADFEVHWAADLCSVQELRVDTIQFRPVRTIARYCVRRDETNGCAQGIRS